VAQRSLKMLVADDSRTIQLFFRNIVAKSTEAIELIAAKDGRECAAKLEGGGLDLAFIDVNMPEMSGMEALGAARHRGNKTFVTVMSTNGSAPRLEVARQLNVYEYLIKPFTVQDVSAVIGTCRRISAPMRTLIVDDSRTVRGVIRRVLEQSIFRLKIEEADDGMIGLERCRETPFDIVFLDCNMPGFDSFETLDRLRQRKRDARVIMISAERIDARIAKALECGAAAFLQKPFFAADVDRAMHHALGLKMPRLSFAPARAPETAATSGAVFLEDALRQAY
jgi:CheY-like chemotaxis protein